MGGGGGGGRGRGQGGCERRIEVFVKIQKKKIFFLGGMGVGAGGVHTKYFSHHPLSADTSFKFLSLILFEIWHLQNFISKHKF